MKCLLALCSTLRLDVQAAILGMATCVALAGTTPAQAPATPCHVGTWSPVYDWHQTNLPNVPAPSPGCDSLYASFSHAALLPTGDYRGKVLLWRIPVESMPGMPCHHGNMTSHMFDPGRPTVLTEIVGNYGHALFMCSGMSWDSRGGLLAVGGRTHVAPNAGTTEIWRFNPFALGATLPPMSPGNTNPWPIISAPTAWSQLSPSLGVARYYPTIIGLNRSSVSVCNNISMAGKHLVSGGNWDVNSQHSLEFWEMVPMPGTAACVLEPSAPVNIGQLVPGTARRPYTEDPGHLPEILLDSYPRMMQITSGQVFVAGDVYAGITGPLPNMPGQSWVMTPPYTVPNWMLSDGPDAAVFPGVDPSNDRHYGNAVIFHTRDSDGAGGFVQNRIFTFNGQQDPTYFTGSSPMAINRTVQEFVPGGTQAENTGTWDYRAPLLSPRMYANAVIVPTRDVLILGGYTESVPGGSDIDEYQPELYTIGAPGVPGGGSSVYLLQSSIPSGQAHPTPRRYHSNALLLPDGRVFMVGGEDWTGSPTAPESQYSGEMYSPPYLFTGYRPVITAMCPTDLPFQVMPAPTYDIDVTTTEGPITKVVLLRPAAVTHDFDDDQRYIELEFTTTLTGAGAATVTLKAPTEDLGPPGWYMLFLIESGPCGPAPSVGQFMRFR